MQQGSECLGLQAPFKLTSELVDVMGGRDSAAFGYFRELCVQVCSLIGCPKPNMLLLLHSSRLIEKCLVVSFLLFF